MRAVKGSLCHGEPSVKRPADIEIKDPLVGAHESCQGFPLYHDEPSVGYSQQKSRTRWWEPTEAVKGSLFVTVNPQWGTADRN